MKNLIYITVFIGFFSCKENSSSGEETTSGDDTTAVEKTLYSSGQSLQELQNIEDIRMEHSYITSKIASGSMDSTSFNYNCNGEKKGQLIYYYDEEQLRMIKHSYNEYSHFSATDEYFLKDAALFFAFFHHETWNFAGQNQTKDDVTENRLYIIGNRPVKCLQKKYTILSNENNPVKPNMVPNKEIECTSVEHILEDFELLLKLRNQKEDLNCLEDVD